MKQAWFMVIVDPGNSHSANFKSNGCDTPHFAYVAWQLEQYAANPSLHKTVSGAGEFHGEPYGETNQIVTFDFLGDDCRFEVRGTKLKVFHAIIVASMMRMQAISGLQQQLVVQGVMQAMQIMAANQKEKPIVDRIMEGIRN